LPFFAFLPFSQLCLFLKEGGFPAIAGPPRRCAHGLSIFDFIRILPGLFFELEGKEGGIPGY